ncbi:hypothetical protein HDU76_009030, partial [Blyttiomyces sp. JEL0837]
MVTGKDLPQVCRARFPMAFNIVMWILAEIAIMATDLAEVIGSAIAMNLLFGLPIHWGVLITGADVLVILAGWNDRFFRFYEVMPHNIHLHSALVQFRSPFRQAVFMDTDSTRSSSDIDTRPVASSDVKVAPIVGNDEIEVQVVDTDQSTLDANTTTAVAKPKNSTTMTNNTFTTTATDHHHHPGSGGDPLITTSTAWRIRIIKWLTYTSSGISVTEITPTKRPLHLQKAMQTSMHHANIDSLVALAYAMVVNSCILIVAASASSWLTSPDAVAQEMPDTIATIPDAYKLLQGMLGHSIATVFAVGLLLSGQCSTITGTLAGQVVMEGFLGGEDVITSGNGSGGDVKQIGGGSGGSVGKSGKEGKLRRRGKANDKDTSSLQGFHPWHSKKDGDVAGAAASPTPVSPSSVGSSGGRVAGGLRGAGKDDVVEVLDVEEGWVQSKGNAVNCGEVDNELSVVDKVMTAGGVDADNNSKTMQKVPWGSKLIGFFRQHVWARRLATRVVAIIPALVVSITLGPSGVDKLLVLSQVILGILLPFSIWPLVLFTSSRRIMTVRYVDVDGDVRRGGSGEKDVKRLEGGGEGNGGVSSIASLDEGRVMAARNDSTATMVGVIGENVGNVV